MSNSESEVYRGSGERKISLQNYHCHFQRSDSHGMEVEVSVEDIVKLIEDLSRIHWQLQTDTALVLL